MRINKLVATATGLSRRAADQAIDRGQVSVNGHPATVGQEVSEADEITLHGQKLTAAKQLTIMLNKPAGFVVSRTGQGSRTVYDLLPLKLHHLKPVGRIDKDSSGLLLLTNDGRLAQTLTHPKFAKRKVYEIELDRALASADKARIEEGLMLDDGASHLELEGRGKSWTVTMQEGRNRQIRRTFARLGYTVTTLHRTDFGNYTLGNLQPGNFIKVRPSDAG